MAIEFVPGSPFSRRLLPFLDRRVRPQLALLAERTLARRGAPPPTRIVLTVDRLGRAAARFLLDCQLVGREPVTLEVVREHAPPHRMHVVDRGLAEETFARR